MKANLESVANCVEHKRCYACVGEGLYEDGYQVLGSDHPSCIQSKPVYVQSKTDRVDRASV